MNLQELPPELFFFVASFLTWEAHISLSLTCSDLYHSLKSFLRLKCNERTFIRIEDEHPPSTLFVSKLCRLFEQFPPRDKDELSFSPLLSQTENVLKAEESSPPHFSDQSINQTLSPERYSYWSSLPNSNQNTDEFLIYSIKPKEGNIFFVREVHLRFYHTYFPFSVQVSIGSSKEQWHYRSDVYPLTKDGPETLPLQLREPVPGSFLRFDLRGKFREQYPGDGYYCVVNFVTIVGDYLNVGEGLECQFDQKGLLVKSKE